MSRHIFEAKYTDSWALIIGINAYPDSPLEYARQDAEAIEEILVDTFEFPKNNVISLYDKKATRQNILHEFMSFTEKITNPNDRLLVFFAGHGDTKQSNRGEVGYLIPVDSTESLSSLIRWDELTRNADLIPAKHILFIMDACYGGTAITRKIHNGSMRFIKDMLSRLSRQVITAGKADEVVADAGGPIPNHSIFTGHLIQALEGNAAAKDGSITANRVMSYVYEKVAKDNHSNQTPHFGFIDGDGDFIFSSPALDSDSNDNKEGNDYLVEYPFGETILEPINDNGSKDVADIVKEYIPDEKYLIKLDDLVTLQVQKAIALIKGENLSCEGTISEEELQSRLGFYENTIEELIKISIVIGYWGKEEHSKILQKMICRLCEHIDTGKGNVAKLYLQWYPVLLIFYSGGISSMLTENYQILSALMNPRITLQHDREETVTQLLGKSCLELARTELFKLLPDYERKYVPRSEYLFKIIQPFVDEILFVGNAYDAVFDKFEAFFALQYAHLKYTGNRIWGPIGRFGWKYHNRNNIIQELREQANLKNGEWAPLRYGFFDGSMERYTLISNKYEELIKGLPWI